MFTSNPFLSVLNISEAPEETDDLERSYAFDHRGASVKVSPFCEESAWVIEESKNIWEM